MEEGEQVCQDKAPGTSGNHILLGWRGWRSTQSPAAEESLDPLAAVITVLSLLRVPLSLAHEASQPEVSGGLWTCRLLRSRGSCPLWSLRVTFLWATDAVHSGARLHEVGKGEEQREKSQPCL